LLAKKFEATKSLRTFPITKSNDFDNGRKLGLFPSGIEIGTISINLSLKFVVDWFGMADFLVFVPFLLSFPSASYLTKRHKGNKSKRDKN
jgi:hypothetical protein